jgi:hypothetical protein
LSVFIRIPGSLPNEYKCLNYWNYSNNGYSNENFSDDAHRLTGKAVKEKRFEKEVTAADPNGGHLRKA